MKGNGMPVRTYHQRFRTYTLLLAALLPALILAGCGSVPPASASAGAQPRAVPPSGSSRTLPALPRAGSGRGGYYQDDGPGDAPPEGLLDVPDAEPRIEPYSSRGNRPYVVFGKTYTPLTDDRPYKQRGIGSWYGKKFHGQKTSSGERYDMYKMTAAHPTLPIPSYARVTNLANGKQVIVRINDRGPFLSSRIIDLSYTAALKLGYLGKGSSELEVERLLPDEIARMAADRKAQLARNEQAMPTPEVLAAAAATVETTPTAQPAQTRDADDSAIARFASLQSAPADAGSTQPAVVTSAPAALFGSFAPGFYLQLGSYTQAANAEAARSRLMQKWAAGLPPVQTAGYGTLYRLYSGPYASRAEAAAAAQVLKGSSASRPIVVQR
jgi:rare lipoprotein A